MQILGLVRCRNQQSVKPADDKKEKPIATPLPVRHCVRGEKTSVFLTLLARQNSPLTAHLPTESLSPASNSSQAGVKQNSSDGAFAAYSRL